MSCDCVTASNGVTWFALCVWPNQLTAQWIQVEADKCWVLLKNLHENTIFEIFEWKQGSDWSRKFQMTSSLENGNPFKVPWNSLNFFKDLYSGEREGEVFSEEKKN